MFPSQACVSDSRECHFYLYGYSSVDACSPLKELLSSHVMSEAMAQ